MDMLQEDFPLDWGENEYWKIKVSKNEGAKYVTSVKIVEKKLDGEVFLTDNAGQGGIRTIIIGEWKQN